MKMAERSLPGDYIENEEVKDRVIKRPDSPPTITASSRRDQNRQAALRWCF